MKSLFFDVLFPKLCLLCGKEGDYLCPDCQSCLDVSEHRFCLCDTPKILSKGNKCSNCESKKIDGLYFAVSYENKLIKKIIHQFKYEPFVKDLAKPLTNLIIAHFLLLNKGNQIWKNKILIPVPLSRKKLKARGFNQAEEIAKILAKTWQIPLFPNCLIKTRATLPQTELSGKERKENMKGSYKVDNEELIKGKNVILIDDTYGTGATMEEAVRTLKEAGVREVLGVTIARGI